MADNTIEIVEKLIETCRDGQEGYREAAEHTESPDLKSFYHRQSLERAKFAGELEGIAHHLGESDPDRSPSLAGRVHRAWFDIKQKLGGGDSSVLESVEAGEDRALKNYQEALREVLPSNVHAIIESQARSILSVHDQVRMMQDSYKKAA